MSHSSDRVSRGARVQEIQAELGDDNAAFCERLNRTATELGFEAAWFPNRLSKVRTGLQDLSIEDMTTISRVDPQQRGWTYVSFGVPVKKGEDAYTVLARMAKKAKSA